MITAAAPERAITVFQISSVIPVAILLPDLAGLGVSQGEANPLGTRYLSRGADSFRFTHVSRQRGSLEADDLVLATDISGRVAVAAGKAEG
jgi:hypothetical protein